MDNRLFAICLVLAVLAFRLAQAWLAHRRVERNLDILKSYADQGREPPPEIVKILQPDSAPGEVRLHGFTYGLWIPVFLFASMSVGFVFMALSGGITDGDKTVANGMIFVAILMGGLALGFLVTALLRRRTENQSRLPPQ